MEEISLEVNFFGEAAQDFGGPRKEYFSAFMQEFKQRMLTTNNGTIILKREEEAMARHHFYYAGLLIGKHAHHFK